MKKYTAPLACLAIAIALAIAIGSRVDRPIFAEAKLDHTFTGICTHVIDGDTIDCSNGTEVKRVRLRGIDAPEAKQPFGTAAKMNLAKRLEKRAVTVVWRKTEKYGRLLGDVYAGELHINEDLIHAGLAWRYYEKSPAWDKLFVSGVGVGVRWRILKRGAVGVGHVGPAECCGGNGCII